YEHVTSGVQTALGRPQLHPSPPSFTALHDGFTLSRPRSVDAVVRSTEARSTEQYDLLRSHFLLSISRISTTSCRSCGLFAASLERMMSASRAACLSYPSMSYFITFGASFS